MRPPNRFKYTPEHCDKLVKYMGQGMTNMQIAAKMDITEKTFYEWIEKHEDFREAYDLGDPKRFAYILEQGDKYFLDGQNGPQDKGYKHWQKKMNYIYKTYAPDSQVTATTNNIQIGNMNLLSQKTDVELLDILNQKLLTLRMDPQEALDVPFEEGTNDDEGMSLEGE